MAITKLYGLAPGELRSELRARGKCYTLRSDSRFDGCCGGGFNRAARGSRNGTTRCAVAQKTAAREQAAVARVRYNANATWPWPHKQRGRVHFAMLLSRLGGARATTLA